MLVELTMRRRPPKLGVHSPIDGIRILAMLPKQWNKDLRQAAGDVVIRVQASDGTTSSEIRAEVAGILTDPAVSNWEIVSCDFLANGNYESKD